MKGFSWPYIGIKSPFKRLKRFIQNHLAECRIDAIDLKTNQIIIHFRGISSVIKMALEDAANDISLISKLSPVHACWLGYYYGRRYQQTKNTKEKKTCLQPCADKGLFELMNSYNRLMITVLDREGFITYCDRNTRETYRAPVTHLVKDNRVLVDFHPTQACYLGIQAGIFTEKFPDRKYSIDNRPKLKIIK